MSSKDITVTQGRMEQAMNNGFGKIIENSSKKIIKNDVEPFKIRTGVVTKFYPYWDKAEVKFDNTDKKVLCKILHRFGGELIDYYTPVGDEVFDDDRTEKCVIPMGDLHCLIVNIHDVDSNEYLLLGFYSNEELLGVDPASQGNFKIVTRGGTNQFWIKFGYDGLDLRLPDKVTTSTGEMDSEMKEFDYANSKDVYTKLEIDDKLKEISVEIDLVKVVTTLPTLSEETLNHVYFLIVEDGFEVYLPYVYQGNYAWKYIGGSGGGGGGDVPIVTEWSNNPSNSKVPSEKLTKNALDSKSPSSHSHSYNELSNKPSIPTRTSELQNDSGFITGLPSHNHDDRYFTESEMNTKLAGKSDINHTHSGYAPSSHNHDDRYYQENEVDDLLNDKLDVADAFSGSYNDLDDVPSTFNPSSHNHSISNITNLQSQLNSKLESNDVGAAALSNSYNDLDDKPTIPSDLTSYIQKSNIPGLIKNDGTIDSTQYLSSLPSHNHNLIDLNNVGSDGIPIFSEDTINRQLCYADLLIYDITDNKFYYGSVNPNYEIAVKNDIPNTSNFIQKNSTSGLIKNDGSVDTNQYLTQHQSLANYVQTNDSRLSDARTPLSHNHTKANITDFNHDHNVSDLNNVSTVEVVVTYTDNTTETVRLLKYTGS